LPARRLADGEGRGIVHGGPPALMPVVQVFDSLLEAERGEQAEADGGHVDEELFPGKDGVLGWVDFHAVRWALDCLQR